MGSSTGARDRDRVRVRVRVRVRARVRVRVRSSASSKISRANFKNVSDAGMAALPSSCRSKDSLACAEAISFRTYIGSY